MTILNEEKNIENWKKSLEWWRAKDVKKISLIEDGKKIGINEVITSNEIINNSLK